MPDWALCFCCYKTFLVIVNYHTHSKALIVIENGGVDITFDPACFRFHPRYYLSSWKLVVSWYWFVICWIALHSSKYWYANKDAVAELTSFDSQIFSFLHLQTHHRITTIFCLKSSVIVLRTFKFSSFIPSACWILEATEFHSPAAVYMARAWWHWAKISHSFPGIELQ